MEQKTIGAEICCRYLHYLPYLHVSEVFLQDALDVHESVEGLGLLVTQLT